MKHILLAGLLLVSRLAFGQVDTALETESAADMVVGDSLFADQFLLTTSNIGTIFYSPDGHQMVIKYIDGKWGVITDSLMALDWVSYKYYNLELENRGLHQRIHAASRISALLIEMLRGQGINGFTEHQWRQKMEELQQAMNDYERLKKLYP